MAKRLLSRRSFITAASAVATTSFVATGTAKAETGTFRRPFSTRSLWNSRPKSYTLGSAGIPQHDNIPYLEQSKYASKMFLAQSSDGPILVEGRDQKEGIWIADELRHRNVSLPRFPEGTAPAIGTDGHCEILDPISGLLHSFFRLIYDRNSRVWRASKYTVTEISGSGWGSPESPDGPRASGTPSTSGILRTHELGQLKIQHALAISGHGNVFRSGPQFPATLEDMNAPTNYTGALPMGTLLMLPQDFPSDKLSWPNSRVIAETLKEYGGRLVDQTDRTFSIISEIDSGWSQAMSLSGKWQNSWAQDLLSIRNGLRQVNSIDRWIDADGTEFVARPWEKMNLISMRGPWATVGNSPREFGDYNTSSRDFRFTERTETVSYRKIVGNRAEKGASPWFDWMKGSWYFNPTAGEAYKLSVVGFGDATASLECTISTGERRMIAQLGIGSEMRFEWPYNVIATTIVIRAERGPEAAIKLLLEMT